MAVQMFLYARFFCFLLLDLIIIKQEALVCRPSRSSETIKISKEGPPNTPCISTKHTTVYTAVVYFR